jgi:hypothetical protein
MSESSSFDVLLLGFTDPGPGAHARYTNAMERLTGRAANEFSVPKNRSDDPIFRALDNGTAKVVSDALEEAGVLIEIRRTSEIASEVRDQVVATEACPTCNFVQPAGTVECSRCGVVFAKIEREQVQQMQQSQHLEEALTKALQTRDEWAQKAAHYLEGHPLQEGAISGFENSLLRDEVPFLRLTSDEGPILMTSRRMISNLTDGVFSIPYEMVGDVTMGGGLVQKKSRVRLQLGFHSQIQTPGGAVKQYAWQLDKESSFFKDVIMDWSYSRVFLCGSCGLRDLDYRVDGSKSRARCMHCATDHEIDLSEGIAIPIATD